MSKVFMTKRKIVTAVIAVVMCALIIFGGTFAWQSIQQEALNEVSATVNPGGRLHDDFVEITDESDEYKTITYNKDIYVENYTSRTNNGVQIFARVRLDEYMEFGAGAGTENSTATSLIDGALLNDRTTWSTLQWDQENNVPAESPFSEYWTYSWGNTEKINYMPTFNLDNTSLDPDVNGAVYFDKDGNREEVAYTDYSGQVAGLADVTEKNDTEIYTPDADGNAVTVDNVTHTIEQTETASVISMEQWIAGGMQMGNFWVYDTDGWAYYASPINPDFATGLLMTGIQRQENIINEDWYYAINVVAQFITKDDLGDGTEENPGFNRAGEQPTAEALQLLNKIGVEVTFEVDSAAELAEALTHGGNVILNNDVTIDTNLVVSADTTLDLNGHTISNTASIYDDEETNVWSLISVQGSDTTLTINSGNFTALENDCFAVDVRDGARVVINDGNFVGNISAVYVHTGSALINGGTFSIQQPNTTAGEGAHDQMINAYDANYATGDADITICGGTFYGFNPTAANDADLVPAGYSVSNADGVYTVAKTVTE